MSIMDHVRDGQMATFIHFVDNQLWYRTDSGFEFPVPLSDTGGAIFLAQDKAIFFTRWIRKHAKFLEDAQAAEILKGLAHKDDK